MEIIREPQCFIINQQKFTLELLEEFGCSGVVVSSPLDPSSKLHAELMPPLDDPTLYRHLIGKINYLTNTQPDICFDILTLSQYMQKPSISHFSAGLRVLRYLHSDPAQGGAPISWKSKKHVSLSFSSAEVEYRSMRGVTVEITWLVCLLTDLSAPPTLPVTFHSDSQAAIYIARNPVFYERTKHVELDCHFVH
uniref:Uncharacterized mitochondrial protein AtMg00810-like n=1 Tax=Nicotiana tabacum TaxID=4097 RepID=A0A1S3X102_TOBAC|nr:PREDICTED: uncharacterized mitochondrial protein AtMg00810-like [Nicotiana tabacum]